MTTPHQQGRADFFSSKLHPEDTSEEKDKTDWNQGYRQALEEVCAAGMTAYRAGQAMSDCPHVDEPDPAQYARYWWISGWRTAYCLDVQADNKPAPRITATLKRSWTLMDSTTRDHAATSFFVAGTYKSFDAGTYELERIPNPYGRNGTWLIVKGTAFGQSEGSWRQWRNGALDGNGQPIDWNNYEITIQED